MCEFPLREKFMVPEKVENLFKFVATELENIIIIRFKSINEIIGRTDLLSQVIRSIKFR